MTHTTAPVSHRLISLVMAGIPTPALAEVTQADIDAAQAELVDLSNRAIEADSALQETLFQLEQTRTSRDDCEAQVEQHTSDLQAAQQRLASSVSVDYKSGSTSLIDLILGARNVEELVDRIHYATKTMRQQEDTIAEVRTLRDTLEQERSELDELEASLEDLATQQEEAAADLEASTQAQQSYLDGLSEEMRQQVEAAEQSRLAEERAQAEAAAKAAQKKAEGETSGQASPVKQETSKDQEADEDSAANAEAEDASAEDEKAAEQDGEKKAEAGDADADEKKEQQAEEATEAEAEAEPEATPEPESEPEPEPELEATPEPEPVATTAPSNSSELGQRLVEAAMSQIGVPYRSCHYGPKGDPFGRGEGFGCAMFVAYCYNHVLFNDHDGMDSSGYPVYDTGFVGWTQSFWSSVAREPYGGINPGFVEVSADQAQPGDVICCVDGGDPYSTGNNCHHVALYVGNGQQMCAGGKGPWSFNMYQGNLHYLHYVGA